MSRTREIDIYVHPEDVRDYGYFNVCGCLYDGPMKDGTIKAKLIIELPERKVTISESEFDDALEEVVRVGLFHYGSAYYNNIKSKLFKDA